MCVCVCARMYIYINVLKIINNSLERSLRASIADRDIQRRNV